jgi:hypothetical protein
MKCIIDGKKGILLSKDEVNEKIKYWRFLKLNFILG